MFDPSQVLSKILTNLTSNAHPPRPQLSSSFDYFVKNYSADLIDPVVIEKWTGNHGTMQMTRMNNESSLSNERFYSIPASFFNQVAVEVFNSLSDADQLEIQQATERACHNAVNEYKDEMKKLYRNEGTDHGECGALEMAARVLEPVMAALEALTDLHIMGWAGGSASTSNGIGIIKISGQCGGPTEPPMIFPRSQADLIRPAAQQWMAQAGGQVIEQWFGASPYPTAEHSLTKIEMKRKNLGDDIRLVKKTKTADSTNIAAKNSTGISSLTPTPDVDQCSISNILETSSSEGRMIGPQGFVKRRAPFFPLPTPTSTPLRSVSAPQKLHGPQTSSTSMRHRSESLPPILTLKQDEGSATYRSQVTRSASEGLRLLIQKRRQKNNSARVTADEENRKYLLSLIATVPASAKNLHLGLQSVIKVDLGSAFRDIVTLLIEIETLHGFRSPRKGLPVGLRPPEVSTWIAAGRGRQGGRVNVADIELFSKAWWIWWTDMQPHWRERDAHGKPKQVFPVRVEEEDWTRLYKPGANGLISVVAALCGWGTAIKKQTVPLGFDEKKADWFCAVEDCRWVMERIIKYLKEGQEEEWSDSHGSEDDELDVETMDGDYDYMQE